MYRGNYEKPLIFMENLFYCFKTKDRLYFIIQYYKATDLFNFLREQPRFNEERVKFYAIQLILALDQIHQQNLYYLDLRPENIMLDDKGNIVLTDFG